MSTSILTRAKAHDIIRRMLASLGDPYTRFLEPEEVNLTHLRTFNLILKWLKVLIDELFVVSSC